MKQLKLFLILFACVSIFVTCKKENTVAEIDKLPPATQTGANTFGCLVNGKAWVAQTDCKFLCDEPFQINFNSTNGGQLLIKAVLEHAGLDQRISFGMDSTNTKSIFQCCLSGSSQVDFTFTGSNCGFLFSGDMPNNSSGSVIITHYDLSAGIVAGTFKFNFSKPGCEVISITEGRFDKKL